MRPVPACLRLPALLPLVIAVAVQDNDIVLCDGPCGRAYHAQCTVPAFLPEELSEEADWLCPSCQTKARALNPKPCPCLLLLL